MTAEHAFLMDSERKKCAPEFNEAVRVVAEQRGAYLVKATEFPDNNYRGLIAFLATPEVANEMRDKLPNWDIDDFGPARPSVLAKYKP